MPATNPPWFVRVGERYHPLLLPGIALVLGCLPYLLGQFDASEFSGFGMSNRQMQGTALLFALLPPYSLLMQYHAWHMAHRSAAELEPLTPRGSVALLRELTGSPGWWTPLIVTAGTLYGSNDFSQLDWVLRIRELSWFDLWFRLSAIVAWGFVFWMLAWRLYCTRALHQIGGVLELDVYRLDRLRHFMRVPLFHLLIVMGAMALMPLQALDLDLRWINYRAGLLVGVPAAILLFVLPTWALHKNMRQTIVRRLDELQLEIDHCDRSDFAQLALLTQHRETVRGFSSWPVDVGLIGKLLFYLVIPPLAWVAAALVERMVDTFV